MERRLLESGHWHGKKKRVWKQKKKKKEVSLDVSARLRKGTYRGTVRKGSPKDQF